MVDNRALVMVNNRALVMVSTRRGLPHPHPLSISLPSDGTPPAVCPHVAFFNVDADWPKIRRVIGGPSDVSDSEVIVLLV